MCCWQYLHVHLHDGAEISFFNCLAGLGHVIEVWSSRCCVDSPGYQRNFQSYTSYFSLLMSPHCRGLGLLLEISPIIACELPQESRLHLLPKHYATSPLRQMQYSHRSTIDLFDCYSVVSARGPVRSLLLDTVDGRFPGAESVEPSLGGFDATSLLSWAFDGAGTVAKAGGCVMALELLEIPHRGQA
jgi:hypothetical protein